jgi:hypothetical protein
MYEKLENFEINQVWILIESSHDVNVIGIKWVFKNKQGVNSEGVIAQGFSQVEGIDFGKTFAPIARLEAIQILLALVDKPVRYCGILKYLIFI